MSKYDVFLHKQDVVRKVKMDVKLSLGQRMDGIRDSSNDKASFSFSFNGLANAPFAPIKLWLDMTHGYYGSSSAYSNTSEEVGAYVARACNALSNDIARKTLELAQQDLDKAQDEARDEALSVLGVVKGEGKGEEEAIQEIW